jgi:NAD(P)-dependent dehydrogenase (short-subunit alcohol dehydrogenase family)
MTKPVCVVVGVGPGNGAALARRFTKEGYAAALVARSDTFSGGLAKELDGARAYRCDVSSPASIGETFAAIQANMGPVEALLYNAGSGTWANVEQIRVEDFEASFRVNTLGLLCCAKHVIPSMKAAQRGSIVVIGATASRRGMPMTAAFAPAKAAQKSLAESMARHLGPAGVHVSLIVVDGVVDLPRTREQMKDKPDSFFIRPDDVADTAMWLTRQSRSAWTFEVEVRPFGEKW